MTVTQKMFAVIALSLVSAASFAQGKVVVLDPTGAVMATAAAKAKFEKLQKSADFAAAKAKLDGLAADIKALQTEYQKDGMTWSAEKRAESEKKLQSLGQDYQFQGKKLQGEQQALMQQIMQELGPKMETVVKQLVESENISMIVDAKSVMMAKPENDLTPKVTELLNKAK
ncbi:OmpH family outer membrane protein [Cellvibrio fontiphilus]|uniref:OmpH family outer membrane protein n=1 Tax=Cellvibrio fontiphilus TaxID=1815559 RepID=A0ABV7FI30_9GAMM|nr:OmpH family outer membrane protein [Cellvibrio fontiphilus]